MGSARKNKKELSDEQIDLNVSDDDSDYVEGKGIFS